MSDSEEADFLVESWTLRGENVFKDDNKHQKTLKSRTSQTLEKKRAKKTRKKLKNAVMERKEKNKKKTKEKKKRKKKKKQNLALELDEQFIFTQVGSTQAALTETPETVNPRQKDKRNADNQAQDALKKSKRKKMVAFGLSPTFIRVKRPKLACSSLKEMEAAGHVENCLQVTVKGRSHNQACDNDSGEDMNSQDLFITQKTFRPSSSEDSQRPIPASLQVFTQRDTDLQTAAGEIKQRPGESEKPTETQVNLSKRRKGSEDVEARAVDPYKDVPVFPNLIPASVSSCAPFVSQSTLLAASTRSTSTQTENFFTTELSSYMSFCYGSRVTADLKPLDLSLPHRVRKDPCLSAKMSAIDVETSLLPGDDQNNVDVSSSGSPQVAHIEVKSESSGQSPKSEADPRSIDTTASSEDDQPCRKPDLIQVRAVQTKLNKPFFFKTKGEAQSPRPESPLMKLSQGRDVKIKKRHRGRREQM